MIRNTIHIALASVWTIAALNAHAQTVYPAQATAQPDADTANPKGKGVPHAGTVPDVTVTAEHRDENVQKAPLAITAFDKDQLETQQIKSVRDLAGTVPNFTMPRASISYGTQNFWIRGIGEGDLIQESAVGVYVDDVYIPRAISSMVDFNDVERVEVLRGPQGTLYGRNSSAGAVRIITADPDETKRASVEVGAGNYGAFETRDYISGPIIDSLLFGSLSYIRNYRGGTSSDPSLGFDVNRINTQTLRGKLRFTPTPDWDIQLTLNGTYDKSDTTAYTPKVQPGGGFSPYVSYSSLYPADRLTQGGAALRVIRKISPNLEFKSVSVYQAFNLPVNYDNSGQAAQIQQNLTHYKQNYVTQEFQLNGNYQRFAFTTGIFLYHERFLADRDNNTFQAASGVVTRFGEYSTTSTNSVALYGQGTYRITDKLSATAGLRWTREKKLFDYNHYTLDAAQQITGLQFSTDSNHTWSSLTPKIEADYQWTPDLNQYAYIARGFKAGGYDNRAPTLLAAQTPFQPETVTTYETGVKADWLGQRLRTNIAVFYNQYDDLQATALDGATGVIERFNAAKARTWGVELETQAAVTNRLSVQASAGYLNAKYDTFLNAGGPGTNAAGKDLVYAPRWTLSAGVSYNVPVSLPGLLRVAANAQFQSSASTTALNTAITDLPAQHFVNANVSYVSANGHWTTTLAVENILNGQYPQSVGYSPATTQYYFAYNTPRTYMLTLRYDL